MKQLILALTLVAATVNLANSDDARWNIGATAEERAQVAKKLRCGVEPTEGPAVIIDVPRIVKNRTRIVSNEQEHDARSIGPVAEFTFAVPQYRDKKKVAKEISHAERAWLSKNAVTVYPSSAIDCFVAALSNMSFEQRTLSNSIINRLNRSEADVKAVTVETLAELLARIERLEGELRRLQGESQ